MQGCGHWLHTHTDNGSRVICDMFETAHPTLLGALTTLPQMERRDRLRKLVAEREAADLGGLPAMGAIEVVEEEKLQTEVFYTEGTGELLAARKGIAQWSLRRGAARTGAAKRQKTDEGGLQVRGRRCGVTVVGCGQQCGVFLMCIVVSHYDCG
jgi:hypothetical protein